MSRRVGYEQALLNATLMDDLPMIRQALSDGADVNTRDAEHQETPLMLARSQAAARLLLDHGGDVGARDNRGQTAFMSHRWPLLAERGSDINAQDENRETALMKAVMSGDLQDVNRMLALGSDMHLRDGDGRTALSIARHWGLVAIAERLKAAGAEE